MSGVMRSRLIASLRINYKLALNPVFTSIIKFKSTVSIDVVELSSLSVSKLDAEVDGVWNAESMLSSSGVCALSIWLNYKR